MVISYFRFFFFCWLMNIFLTQFWIENSLIHKPQPCLICRLRCYFVHSLKLRIVIMLFRVFYNWMNTTILKSLCNIFPQHELAQQIFTTWSTLQIIRNIFLDWKVTHIIYSHYFSILNQCQDKFFVCDSLVPVIC